MDKASLTDWALLLSLLCAGAGLVVALTLHFALPQDNTAYTRGLIEGARQATLKCPTDYKVIR